MTDQWKQIPNEDFAAFLQDCDETYPNSGGKLTREQYYVCHSRNLGMHISFAPCGAQTHPAFSGAKLRNGRYHLHIPYTIKGKKRRAEWCADTVKHLRSFLNSNPHIENEE